ncbi:MAG: hypothetical protein AB1Z98_27680 [Nannocystaceae bacterium]
MPWHQDDTPCQQIGDIEMRCTGLVDEGDDDPPRLQLTGVVTGSSEHPRIDSRITYVADGKTTTLDTDRGFLSVAFEEQEGPSNVSVVFAPGEGLQDPSKVSVVPGPDDGPRWVLAPFDPDGTTKDTYGVCSGYAKDLAVRSGTAMADGASQEFELGVPATVTENAPMHRFRTFGARAGETDLDHAFLSHDPKIVLRAKSGNADTQMNPIEKNAELQVECCPRMPLKHGCSCDERGHVNREGTPRTHPTENCIKILSQCIYNWSENKGQFGCQS